MVTNARHVHASPEDVWAVLADGWLYAGWVVGASRMREVQGWPAHGARLHHSVGAWPALVDDHTEVLAVDPPRSLTLLARAWPTGEAHVRLELGSEGEETVVTIQEDAVSGPGAWIPRALRAPLLGWRNRETLRRLAYLAERRP
jgi:uncharacterized protein YndB with AHSA1/START domain